MNNKRIICAMLVILMMFATLSGCHMNSNENNIDFENIVKDIMEERSSERVQEGSSVEVEHSESNMETEREEDDGEAQRERVVTDLLTSMFTCDLNLLDSFSPWLLRSYNKEVIQNAGYYFVEQIDISTNCVGQLTTQEIEELEDYFNEEPEHYFYDDPEERLTIEDAYKYDWSVTLYFTQEDDGEDQETESNRFDLWAVQIGEVWYAVAQ